MESSVTEGFFFLMFCLLQRLKMNDLKRIGRFGINHDSNLRCPVSRLIEVYIVIYGKNYFCLQYLK